MNAIAFLLDDRSIYGPWRLFLQCAYLPVLVVAASWALIRFRAWLAIVALLLAATSAYIIVSDMQRDALRSQIAREKYPEQHFEPFAIEYVRAAWFCALSPFAMIAVFAISRRRLPNKPVETTRGTQP